MQIVKIQKDWIEVLCPSETMVIAYLGFLQENLIKGRQDGFYGKAEELHKMIPWIAEGTIVAAISRGAKWEFLKLIGKKRDNRLHKVNMLGQSYVIPDYIFMTDKLSPLQKLIYAYIYTRHQLGHVMDITAKQIREDLNVTKHRYFRKDLEFLVHHHFIVMIDKKIYRTAPLPSEDSLKDFSDWHTRFKRPNKKVKHFTGVKGFFVRIWNYLFRKGKKNDKGRTRGNTRGS